MTHSTRFVGLLTWALLCGQAQAQLAGERAGTWEAGFHIADMSSVSVLGSFGAAIDVDNDVGYGLTGTYHFTNRLAVMLEASWSRPDYVATFVPDSPGLPQRISTKLDVTTVQAKGVFHFFEGDVTPFVELGLGWTNVDSNIIDGPVLTDCWWDFFWGFICRDIFDTYHQTEMSYSAAVGVRWDFAENFTIRGSVGTLEIDIDGASEDPSVDTVDFGFAWRF